MSDLQTLKLFKIKPDSKATQPFTAIFQAGSETIPNNLCFCETLIMTNLHRNIHFNQTCLVSYNPIQPMEIFMKFLIIMTANRLSSNKNEIIFIQFITKVINIFLSIFYYF